MKRRAPPRIGCAGWSVPALHKHLLPAQGSGLERYAAVFNAVEINSSFYRPHQHSTYTRWAESVPDSFRFSVKIPRTITHDRHLKGIASELSAFLQQSSGLGDRLGGVLVQLPPSLAFDTRAANAFFKRLRGELPPDVAIACEPRHLSWFAPRLDAFWSRHNVNRVGADPAIAPAAAVPGDAGQWRYCRLHGAPQMYYSAYPAEALTALAETLTALDSVSPPWVIFDNTAAGHAVGNAYQLMELVKAEGKSGHA